MKTFLKGFLSGMLALAAILVCVAAFDGSYNVSRNADMYPVFAKMQQIQKLVDDKFYFEQDADAVASGVYKGMVFGLDDNYSYYLDPYEYKQYLRSLQGNYTGIGASVTQDADTLLTTVKSVEPDGPAARAGMREGDVIVAVDGADVTQTSLENLIYDHIMGDVGTQVVVTVKRGDKRLDLPMTRQKIIDQTVSYRMLDDQTGYLQVTSFEDETVPQFMDAVSELQDKGMRRVVYDLRGNGGGSLSAVVKMLDYLLPDGLLVYTEDKYGNRLETYEGSDGHEVDIPAVILVDEGTASASEVFSSAMRDYGRAQLVGTRTFGKGIVQQLYPCLLYTSTVSSISSTVSSMRSCP